MEGSAHNTPITGTTVDTDWGRQRVAWRRAAARREGPDRRGLARGRQG